MRDRLLTLTIFLALAGCTEPKDGSRHADAGDTEEGGSSGGPGGNGGESEPGEGGSGGARTGGKGGTGAASGGQNGGGTAGSGGTAGGGSAGDAGADTGGGGDPLCNNTQCGLCQACVAGKCQNQAAGQDVKEECDNASPMSCRSGFCDGSGACQKVSGNFCDGPDLVVCTAGNGMRQSCPSGMCSNSQCAACGGSAQPCCGTTCNSGLMCSGGKCVTACVPGASCGTNNMCRAGKISCDTGSPVCVSMAINEGIVCSSRKCSGTTSVVESRCGGGNCVEQTVQNCSSTQTCASGQCKKKVGQPCSSNSECANNSCKGPRFCYQGSNGHCPCVSDAECESTDCRENVSMRTCGGGDCKDYQCNQTPPE